MNKGFTLIEIIVVLIILGVLAAIAVGSYFDWINRSTAAEAYSYIKSLKDQLELCVVVHGSISSEYATCVDNVVNNTPHPPNFIIPVGPGRGWSSPSSMAYKITIVRNGPIEQHYTVPTCMGNIGASFQSGFILCHEYSGEVTRQSWGIFQGM